MKTKRRNVRTAFTMVELMAMLIIIGLLATVVATNVIGKIDRARVTTTKANLRTLQEAVQQFKADTGRYPTEEAGLEELIVEPSDVINWDPEGYLLTTEVPLDGWGEEFIYQLEPESGKAFVIISLGADKQEGGEGEDADLYSTDAR